MSFSSFRSALVAVIAACLPVMSAAQVSPALLQQIDALENLSPAEQQAILGSLSPTERQQLLRTLQPGARESTGSGDASVSPDFSSSFLQLDAALAAAEQDHRLGAGDTLVIEFSGATQSDPDLVEFQERLANANPYELDNTGHLELPGIAPIALAGLNVEEATIRIGAERELRPLDLTVTYLPLDPIGPAGLEPFGYEFFRGDPSRFSPDSSIPVPVDYVIGPGDVLYVQLFGTLEFQELLEVSRDGSISLPEIGPLAVAGLSFSDARDLISERVEDLLIGVTARTTLDELRSIQVFVLGEVQQPGAYAVSGLATMTNALFSSGGITPIGSLRNIRLIRDGEAITTLDLYDLLLAGDTTDDARLQSGDAILVATTGASIAIDGEVRRPAVYEIDDESTIADIIALAGGLNANASQTSVKLERIVPDIGVSVTDLDLTDTATMGLTIRDGDVLRVNANPDRLEASVRLQGNVLRPGNYQWFPGMTLRDLLPAPELVQPMSDLQYVLIRREAIANVTVAALSADLEAIWAGEPGAADPDLEPRDTVYVFHLETGRQQYILPILDELEAQSAAGEAAPFVRVGGQVRARGQYPLEPGMRVSDLLRAGGGLSDAAYATEAELTRYSIADGVFRQTDLIRVDLDAVLAGRADADIALTPYDYLNIKEISRWRDQETVTMRGELVFPGEYPIRQGETLSSVLERAGGLSPFAFPQGSVFTRDSLRERELEQIRLLARRLEADIASLDATDPATTEARATGQSLLNQLENAEATGRLVIRLDELMAGQTDADIVLNGGDELFVPELRQEVTVLGEVQYPTSHTFRVADTRDQYLDRSGGLTRRADEGRIYVVRANGEVVIDSGRRWFRRREMVDIMPGDTIVAPIEIDRVRPLALWTNVTQVLYNLAIAVAAVNSF